MQMKIKEILWKHYEKTIINPVLTSIVILIIVSLFVVGLSLKYYNLEFFENVLVEAHGMLFDIAVIGIFVLFLNEKGKERIEIQKYNNEIDDFRIWKSEEASFRITGNIKRLNKKGISRIDIHDTYLENMSLSTPDRPINLKQANLQGAKLMKADLRNANLEKANLCNADLQGANLQGANLNEANLKGAFLQETNLKNASFQNAVLRDACFRKANFYSTNLKNSDMREVDLSEVNNLTIEQLFSVKTLYNTPLYSENEKKIKEKYPHLLEDPEKNDNLN